MCARRQLHILLLICAAFVASGCVSFEDFRYPLVKKWQTHHAWSHASLNGSAHFKRGWKEGYYKVSTGHDGRVPVVPEKRYWSTEFQNPEGQLAIQDWYAGYRAGALAAEQEGNREWHFIPAIPPDPLMFDAPYKGIISVPSPEPIKSGLLDSPAPPEPYPLP